MPTPQMTYRQILDRIDHDRNGPRATRMVAVDGHGGAGKSTFARRLAARAGQAAIVHLDDFANPGRTNGIDVQRLRDQVIVPLGHDRPARYQRFDWHRQQLGNWRHVEAGGLVIVEGVSALRTELGDSWDLRIWIDTPRDICRQRGLHRDGDAASTLWDTWFAAEDAYVARDEPRARADLVVNGAPDVDHDPASEFTLAKHE